MGTLKRCVLSFFIKVSIESHFLISKGRLFRNRGAQTEKASICSFKLRMFEAVWKWNPRLAVIFNTGLWEIPALHASFGHKNLFCNGQFKSQMPSTPSQKILPLKSCPQNLWGFQMDPQEATMNGIPEKNHRIHILTYGFICKNLYFPWRL